MSDRKTNVKLLISRNYHRLKNLVNIVPPIYCEIIGLGEPLTRGPSSG